MRPVALVDSSRRVRFRGYDFKQDLLWDKQQNISKALDLRENSGIGDVYNIVDGSNTEHMYFQKFRVNSSFLLFLFFYRRLGGGVNGQKRVYPVVLRPRQDTAKLH